MTEEEMFKYFRDAKASVDDKTRNAIALKHMVERAKKLYPDMKFNKDIMDKIEKYAKDDK